MKITEFKKGDWVIRKEDRLIVGSEGNEGDYARMYKGRIFVFLAIKNNILFYKDKEIDNVSYDVLSERDFNGDYGLFPKELYDSLKEAK